MYVKFSLSHIYQTPLSKYRTYEWYSPSVGLLCIMRRQSFMREHFHVVTNVSRTVIAYVAHIYMYNVKRLGGVPSKLNHLGEDSFFSRGAIRGWQLQISHLDDLLGTNVCITRGSSIIWDETTARA